MVDVWGEIIMQQLEASFSIEELQKADLKKLQIYYLGLRLGYELKRCGTKLLL